MAAVLAIPSCPSKIEGLVHYPTTLAPVNGSRAVEAQCADNSHSINSSLNVICVSDGSWSGTIPHCECDLEYYRATINGKQICFGKMPVYVKTIKCSFSFLKPFHQPCVRLLVKV